MASTVILIDNSIHLTDDETITVRTIDDLTALHRQISAYLLAHQQPVNPDRYISSIEARRIAQLRGVHLPATTLVSAYDRGNIANARKIPGSNRWESPESSFLAWLDRWIARQQTSNPTTSRAAPAGSTTPDGAL
jgi:hypothetical protein